MSIKFLSKSLYGKDPEEHIGINFKAIEGREGSRLAAIETYKEKYANDAEIKVAHHGTFVQHLDKAKKGGYKYIVIGKPGHNATVHWFKREEFTRNVDEFCIKKGCKVLGYTNGLVPKA